MPVADEADMGRVDEWPDRIAINAWTGAEVTAPVAQSARSWAIQQHYTGEKQVLLAATRPDDERWLDPKIGWGLVLPDNPALANAERACADDAPDSIHELAAKRTCTGPPVVLRYRSGEEGILYRYYTNGDVHPLATVGGPRGVEPGRLPLYLLLCGGPTVLPWELQFRLNLSSFVGRLDLDETGLKRYVKAALSRWADSKADATKPLVWTVEHKPGDITWLMRQTIAEPVFRRWADDPQIGTNARRISGRDATTGALIRALHDHIPGVVVTTSHGMTGPLGDVERMRSSLGLLVGADHDILDPRALLNGWNPDGLVWYAHACCSAGGSATNRFAGLVDQNTEVHRVLDAIAKLGPTSAPLPKELLGAERPARAFIGHVEPTFDWTLRRDTGQITTDALQTALYTEFFLAEPSPVGRAFSRFHGEAASLLSQWSDARRDVGRLRQGARERALAAQLTGIDRQCTVILGDPAVAPASLPPT